MNTANAVVRYLEATTPVYVSLVDGRSFIVDAPLEGDVRIAPRCAHLRRRVGLVRRFWAAVSVAVGILAGWGAGEGRAPSWDAYAGVRHEPTVLGLTVTHITNLGLDIPADAR